MGYQYHPDDMHIFRAVAAGVEAAAEALELVVAGAVVPAQVAGRGYTVAEMIEDYRKLRAADLSPVMRGAFCHTR